MQIQGSATFPAQRQLVYRVFTDPAALSRATPGIQSLSEVQPNVFAATLKVGVGGISGTFQGTVELREQRPPEHYALAISGQGGPGYVQGTATFDFAEAETGTLVTYAWDVQLGGLLAAMGQRVLSSVAKLLIGQFMAAMAKEVAAAQP